VKDQHVVDLEELFTTIGKYRLKLNPEKCVFGVEAGKHVVDLEELFTTIAKYRLKLNPEKCVFGVEAGKFLGFLLTECGIEANPKKCATIITMHRPISVKEVQQLIGRMVALSRFVSAKGDKGHPYFQ